MLRRGLRRHIDAKVLRHIHALVAEDARERHRAHAVAEVRLVVEVPRLVAHGAVGEVPEVRDLGERGEEALNFAAVKITEVLGVRGRTDDDEVHACLLAHPFNLGDARHAIFNLVELHVHRRVVRKGRVGLEIALHVAYVLDVPRALVVRAGVFVENIKGLGEECVVIHVRELVEGIVRAAEQVTQIVPELAPPAYLRGFAHGKLVLARVVVSTAVDVDAQEDVFDLAVVEQPPHGVLAVVHIRAVEKAVVELRVEVFIQLLDRIGACGGAANDVGVVLIRVLEQVLVLADAGVERLAE